MEWMRPGDRVRKGLWQVDLYRSVLNCNSTIGKNSTTKTLSEPVQSTKKTKWPRGFIFYLALPTMKVTLFSSTIQKINWVTKILNVWIWYWNSLRILIESHPITNKHSTEQFIVLLYLELPLYLNKTNYFYFMMQ